jgi:hypothetical protein
VQPFIRETHYFKAGNGVRIPVDRTLWHAAGVCRFRPDSRCIARPDAAVLLLLIIQGGYGYDALNKRTIHYLRRELDWSIAGRHHFHSGAQRAGYFGWDNFQPTQGLNATEVRSFESILQLLREIQ